MTKAQIFPTVLIVLYVGAVVVYALQGDARRAIYWALIAGITAVVSF